MNSAIRYTCTKHNYSGETTAGNLAKGKACRPCGLEKYENNCLDKYGVSHPSHMPEVKAKAKRTMIQRYGVPHALQSKELFEKMLKTSATRYKVKLAGKVRMVQGYEPRAIKKLIALGIPEKDIAVGNDPRLPSFRWKARDGKTKVYHPDILVVSKNLIIEVKSVYTYFHNLSVNRQKRDAVKREGYAFKFFVADPRTGEPINPHENRND